MCNFLHMPLVYDPTIPFLQIYQKKCKQVHKRLKNVPRSFIHNSKNWETTQRFIKGWRDKQTVDSHTMDYSAAKRTNYWCMQQSGPDLENIMSSKSPDTKE